LPGLEILLRFRLKKARVGVDIFMSEKNEQFYSFSPSIFLLLKSQFKENKKNFDS